MDNFFKSNTPKPIFKIKKTNLALCRKLMFVIFSKKSYEIFMKYFA